MRKRVYLLQTKKIQIKVDGKGSNKSYICYPNEEFLRDYIKQSLEEMNWRRKLEFRLFQYIFLFYSVIATTMVSLYKTTTDPSFYWFLSAVSIILVIGASVFITYRICHEHEAYDKIGSSVQRVWRYFGMFKEGAYLNGESILDEGLIDPEKGFGKGKGYRRTLWLLWFINIVFVGMIYTLAINIQSGQGSDNNTTNNTIYKEETNESKQN